MITAHGNRAEFLGGCVSGIVTAVPTYALENSDWPIAIEASRMTGVQSRRHAAAWQSTESLGLAAARRLMANLGWEPGTIDALVYVTQTPGRAIPAAAYGLHAELGLPAHCPAIEVNWSCSGYVYGLWLAMKLAAVDEIHESRRVLLIVGDTSSQIVDPSDRATAPLFGDAVSATGVMNGPLAGLSYFVLGTDGTGRDRLSMANAPEGVLQMDGAAVFNFTLKTVPGLVEDVLDDGTPNFLLFHQANKFMLDHLVKKMRLRERGFDEEQIPINVDRFGNTSSASIPLLICDKLGEVGARGARLALFGYGAGWAWAGAALDGTSIQCAELLEIS